MWQGYCFDGLKNNETDTEYFDIRKEPFKIYGLYNPKKSFHRLPEGVTKIVDGVASHARNSSGGRIRFMTDSPYIAIRVKHSPYNNGSPHLSRLASMGVDIYINKNGKETYFGSYFPPIDRDYEYEGIKHLRDGKKHEITLYMPTGTDVSAFEIGLKKGSKLSEHSEYKIKTPVVFYGSSITNGYAASRPGNMYEAFISRKLDCDFINLGFSGAAKGEPELAKYIAGLKMSAFVMDYDHNAPNAEHLKKTHKSFFDIIRKNNPDLPIILITKPDAGLDNENQDRRDVVLGTYISARQSGDKNVYYIDGYSLFPDEARNDCTVDGCHPNDLGMYFMAERIGGVLSNVIKEEYRQNNKYTEFNKRNAYDYI